MWTFLWSTQAYCDNVLSATARLLPQHNLNVMNTIISILDAYLNLLCGWSYVDITSRSTAVVWRLHAFLTYTFTIANTFYFSQFNSYSMSLRWDCASKSPFGKWRWLSTEMMLSFASLTNVIVLEPWIIVKAAFVLVNLVLRWKLRADSSIELGSRTKQTGNSSSLL